jgi:hypothetical protein
MTCVAAGVLLGLVTGVLAIPRISGASAQVWQGAVGAGAAALAVMTMRCAPLFLGEAVGILGGLLAAVSAAGAARVWLSRRFV